MIVLQESIANELLNTTDVTIIGILLVACLFLGLTVKNLYKKCIEIQEERVKDKEKSQEIIVELAEKTITAIHQVTELAKNSNHGQG